MEPIELVFLHKRDEALAIVTFSAPSIGKVRCEVSVRHEPGLSDLKMERYVALWQKWGDRCVRSGFDTGMVPAWPYGWERND